MTKTITTAAEFKVEMDKITRVPDMIEFFKRCDTALLEDAIKSLRKAETFTDLTLRDEYVMEQIEWELKAREREARSKELREQLEKDLDDARAMQI